MSLAQFEGEPDDDTSFSKNDRLDGAFASLLEARGVPKEKVMLLLDKDATTAKVQKSFADFLAKSADDELLLFYYGSHGGYDAKTGVYTFSTFDGDLPMTWAYESVEKSFKGSRAMMMADTCYSGGIVELAGKQSGRVGYFALSTTFRHNVAYSGWRFIDALMRGWNGDAVIDTGETGQVDLETFAGWVTHHMAFVASGKPEWVATKGFDPKLAVADTHGKKKSPEVGKYYKLDVKGKTRRVEVVDADGRKLKVHFTAKGSTAAEDEWVTAESLHPYVYPHYEVGTAAECEYEKKWYACKVLGSYDQMTLIHYDKYSDAWDEYMSPSRIRVPTGK